MGWLPSGTASARMALLVASFLIASALPVISGPLADYYPPPPSYSPPEYYPPPAYYPPPPEYYPPPPPYYPPPPEYYPPPPPPPYYAPPPPPYYPPPPEYYPPPPPPYYAPPPPPYYPPPPPYYTKPEYYSKEYYPEVVNYDAVHYLELNNTLVCGIVPAVNADLYQNAYDPQEYASKYQQYGTSLILKKDVLPFGEAPYRVLITDDYENVVCQGVIVHNRQILTLASCVNGEYPLEKLRVRYGEWDLLNNANEYEAYKNYESRICRILPVTCPSSYGYGYSSYNSELVLLQVELEEDYDKYPQIKPACLPVYPYYPPSYSPPPYSPPPYSPPPYAAPYSPPQYPAAYSPPPYSPPPSYAPVYAEPLYSECWVAGYYASPKTELKNHEPPKGKDYSYAAKDYNPYSNSYYPEYSMIPRKAKVKRVPSYSQSYGYGDCKDEEQQWVGVEGFDACVADKGAAIVCIVDEHPAYDYYASYDSPAYSSYIPAPQYPAYEYYKEILAIAAQKKNARKRAVVVAVVKEITTCTDYENKDYSYGYDKVTSKPIKAIKVSTEDVTFIVDKFFEGALDYSCPVPKSYYPAPSYSPETKAPYYPPPPAYYPPPPPYYPPPPPPYYPPPPPAYAPPPPPYYPPPPPEYYPPPPPPYYSPPPPYY